MSVDFWYIISSIYGLDHRFEEESLWDSLWICYIWMIYSIYELGRRYQEEFVEHSLAVTTIAMSCIHTLLSIWLAQLEVVSRSDACSLMCAVGPPGSVPGADNLDSVFHSYGVGKMSSRQYVDEWLLQKTAKLKRAAIRWLRVAYCNRRRKQPHMVPLRLT